MIAMQYKIKLGNDFDMNLIRTRVLENGFKTDNFQDLFFKMYLIKDIQDNNLLQKEYSPLYLWKNHEGMNKFIFDGFYDNILKSFGWQKINIGIPYCLNLKPNFFEAKYLLEIQHYVQERQTMKNLNLSLNLENLGEFIIYNPDKWKYVEFYLFDQLPAEYLNSPDIYNILWVSK